MRTMTERMQKRRRRDRPSGEVSLPIPDDVIEDLQEIAPALGFSNHIARMRAYIGQGLRKDLERLDQAPVQRLMDSLRKQGLSDEVITAVIAESNFAMVPSAPTS